MPASVSTPITQSTPTTNTSNHSSLEQLKQMTTIVADTGDLAAIARLKPIDATTNPSLITKALTPTDGQMDKQARLIDTMNRHHGDIDKVIDALTVEIGTQILQLIEGRVSTEVDARLSYQTQETVSKALQLMDAYSKQGISPDRVLIKIAATWQGIKAGEILEKQGIHCNLTLLFGQHQAAACADAGVTLISPFVGRILDWQKRQENRDDIAITQDLGVQSVTNIYHHYKQHGYDTQVMGASFRHVGQILALAGCDLLTISPNLLDELAHMHQPVTRKLSHTMAQTTDAHSTAKMSLSQAAFNKAHETDAMTQNLLSKGIDGFITARDDLETLLKNITLKNITR